MEDYIFWPRKSMDCRYLSEKREKHKFGIRRCETSFYVSRILIANESFITLFEKLLISFILLL